MLADTGIVVIARNEGERLVRCLASCARRTAAVVYADSASTDGSVEAARAAGAETVVLDVATRPPNQARGRNAGLARLLELRPELRYAFFVDGDCVVAEGFLEAAHAELERDAGLGAVVGRRREMHPEASVWNDLIDVEWNTPVGESDAMGGDVLMRIDAFRSAGGYDERMSAGEDPEMGFRVRAAGWRILRIDRDMTFHDVALHRFGAWWKRHARGGHAFAHGALLNLRRPGRFNQRRCLSVLGYGLVLPAAALALAFPTRGASLLAFLAYPWLGWRVRAFRVRQGFAPERAGRYARYVVIGKLAEAWGVLGCLLGVLRGKGFRQVEYKDYQRGGPASGAGRERVGAGAGQYPE